MAELIRCDHCKTTVETVAAYTWWQVGTRAQIGIGGGMMYGSGMPPAPAALCSSRCLLEWTREQHDRDEAESEGATPDGD